MFQYIIIENVPQAKYKVTESDTNKQYGKCQVKYDTQKYFTFYFTFAARENGLPAWTLVF